MAAKYLKDFVSLATIVCISCFQLSVTAQVVDTATTTKIDRSRLSKVVLITSASYGLSMGALYQVWYKDSKRQSFRFFDDNKEWKQMDKAGHFFTAFHLSSIGSKTLQWCSLSKNKADVVGPLTGFLMMLPIEIFDGFSSDYGASTGDLIANAGGSLFFFAQQLLWNEVRIIPKFSFHYTSFPEQRPEILGDRWYNQIIKDYNGQTYWLTFDTDKFFVFPGWLNISIGYGANNMLFAKDLDNIHKTNLYPYRQYYFSFDIDLKEIRTRSRLLKKAFMLLNTIKFPAPTVEYSTKGLRLHGIYF